VVSIREMNSFSCQLFSVGHSNHDLTDFLKLLAENEIEILVDVRSYPSSRYSPQFNRNVLSAQLAKSGISYEFFGDSLGGRPRSSDFYDEEGYVLYGKLKESETFLSGVDQLLEMAKGSKVAMMCSEGMPDDCHRHLLVARVLAERNPRIEVHHLHPKGGGISSIKLLEKQAPPQSLFDDLHGKEEMPWKSIQSVSPNTQH